MSGLRLDLGPAKEPIGFIKALQWIFSIFAFATCGGYGGNTSFKVSCSQTKNESVTATFGYPFRLNTVAFQTQSKVFCNETWNDLHLVGDFSSSSQFFVTLAVFAFLYSLAALVLYLGYMHLYRGAGGKLPMADFLITVVFAFLWLVSASAWAKALTDVKVSTGPDLVADFAFCQKPAIECIFDSVSSMGSLNVSVVIGFLNVILWGGNSWFVYKETNLHSPPSAAPHAAGAAPAPSGI
ncbi:synaptophysin-like protein 1 [Alligator mississippiensis]|uniref:Synaptophysin-like protein 1 n=1 Tax=Alligator mississippiensis TaxID=8496 RepID=A0A151NDN8_ALLMI|nr:synaptophysin-like protein 1 [Alligator mississippiensis]